MVKIPDFLRKFDHDAFDLLDSDADPDLDITRIETAYNVDPRIEAIDKSWHSSAKIEKIFSIFEEIDQESPSDKIISMTLNHQ